MPLENVPLVLDMQVSRYRGAQWLSDFRSKGCWFKTHQRHYCVVTFSKTLYPLLSAGSTKE